MSHLRHRRVARGVGDAAERAALVLAADEGGARHLPPPPAPAPPEAASDGAAPSLWCRDLVFSARGGSLEPSDRLSPSPNILRASLSPPPPRRTGSASPTKPTLAAATVVTVAGTELNFLCGVNAGLIEEFFYNVPLEKNWLSLCEQEAGFNLGPTLYVAHLCTYN